MGSPEGELAIANALVFLAVAPKSNAVYVAMDEARADVEQFGTLDVPLRFRNAPTKLMKEEAELRLWNRSMCGCGVMKFPQVHRPPPESREVPRLLR